jgi:serine/threonine-protein kinase
MGLVFRATHLGLRRQVAVKILHPSVANASDVKSRFEREALAVGKIDHPNCVATYDVGRLHDGSLYLAMELLEGQSLADVLEREGQLAPGRALHILAHILRGLGSIHAAGLIHRDIKPENIYLIRQGEDMDFAKILDFGIAKPIRGELSDDNVKLTQAGMAFGTPIYMAPEQALGNPMDGRADLYAAAVIAYEMLCGQPPFYSEDKLEVMTQHTAKPVPPMRNRLVKGGKPVPSSLEKLILRGLTKKPGDRYATAEVFLSAVESALATPDGGQTNVDRLGVGRDTGSQPLVSEDGQVDLEDNRHMIGNAIEDALALAPNAKTAAQSTRATPPAPIAAHVPQPPHVRGGGAGGIGIGLPFTGPTGEPVFGLTPEQRLAQVPPRKPWMLYGGIAMAAIVLGVVVAIMTRPAKHPHDKKLDPASLAGQANALLENGKPNEAIKLLEAQKDTIASDAEAQLVLGHAYAARNDDGDPIEALATYRIALSLDPTLQDRDRLRANLRNWSADTKLQDVVANALDIWSAIDDEGKDALFKALESPSIVRRHAAVEVLDKRHLGTGLDRVKAYTLDLQDQPTCPLRAEAVAKLRAIGAPEAIPALQRAIVRKGTSGTYRNKPINGCLIDDAKAAIGYLESLKP